MKRSQEVLSPRTPVSSKIRIILALSLLTPCVGGAYAQKVGTKTGNPAPPAQGRKSAKPTGRKDAAKDRSAELSLEEQLALARLAAVGERAKGLGDDILKVKTLAQVADALWEYDEARARQFFVAAFQAVDGIKLEAQQDQRAELAERRGGSGPSFHLRSSVLQIVVRRDFELAEELRASYERKAAADADSRKQRQLGRAEQAELYTDVAVALAKTQPERSAQLVRGLMRGRLDGRLAVTLLRIRAENPSLSDRLFAEALALSRARPALPDDIESLAIYVTPTEEEEFYGRDVSGDPTRSAVTQQFLNYVYAAMSSAPDAANGLAVGTEAGRAQREQQALRNLLPLFERFQPERAPFIREKLAALGGQAAPQSDDSPEVPRPNIEDLIRKAESTVGTRRRTMAFMRVSSEALAQGDVEKALAVAQRIEDPYERRIQTSLVLYQMAMREFRAGDPGRAYQYAKGIDFLPQRVAAFQRAAQKAREDKEPERASALLEEVWDWLVKADDSPQKVDAMLKITETMARHDKARGFDFLQAAARALNETNFSYKPPDRERISVEVHVALDMLDLESGFAPLARADSERAFLIAQSLTKAESSLLAQAIVCRQVLRPRRAAGPGRNRAEGQSLP